MGKAARHLTAKNDIWAKNGTSPARYGGLTLTNQPWHFLAMRKKLTAIHLTLSATRLLALLAVFGLAILPQGVMPHVGETGGLELVLCSADGPVSMVIDPITGEASRKSPTGSAKSGCDWALAHSLTTLTAATPTPIPPQTLDRRAAPAMAAALWRPAHDPRGLYARGPPSLT